ncbi:hypothetical protein [uncultured Sphingomonas sp.]|uniref:hypothetical protein n=1 Tax=uncultured Sphingomonas sp. TaxID=158754 RepID=UPI0025D633E3|nr:hypothetical protein [uncultured Sphingomonas sp.]
MALTLSRWLPGTLAKPFPVFGQGDHDAIAVKRRWPIVVRPSVGDHRGPSDEFAAQRHVSVIPANMGDDCCWSLQLVAALAQLLAGVALDRAVA